MAATGFWIGVESMTSAALTEAAKHPHPMFCGRLAAENSLRKELEASGVQAEWHDVALDTPVGQGYLLDLMRQRVPIEHVVWVLPPLPNAQFGGDEATSATLDTVLAATREITEGLLVMIRGAEALLQAGVGGGMTVSYDNWDEPVTPLAKGLMAFVETVVSAESQRWASLGLSLTLGPVSAIEQ